MSAVKTVRIVCDWREEGWVEINESDFHSEKDARWVDPAVKAAEAKAAEDAAAADEAAKSKKSA